MKVFNCNVFFYHKNYINLKFLGKRREEIVFEAAGLLFPSQPISNNICTKKILMQNTCGGTSILLFELLIWFIASYRYFSINLYTYDLFNDV
jgi:hypothetical protein